MWAVARQWTRRRPSPCWYGLTPTTCVGSSSTRCRARASPAGRREGMRAWLMATTRGYTVSRGDSPPDSTLHEAKQVTGAQQRGADLVVAAPRALERIAEAELAAAPKRPDSASHSGHRQARRQGLGGGQPENRQRAPVGHLDLDGRLSSEGHPVRREASRGGNAPLAKAGCRSPHEPRREHQEAQPGEGRGGGGPRQHQREGRQQKPDQRQDHQSSPNVISAARSAGVPSPRRPRA